MKQVILNADDFAFNAAVSRGIVALAQKSRLSATSAMTLSPRWVQDAPALAELRGQIDVGLHLDWTSPFAIRIAGHGSSLPRAMLAAMLRHGPASSRKGSFDSWLQVGVLDYNARKVSG